MVEGMEVGGKGRAPGSAVNLPAPRPLYPAAGAYRPFKCVQQPFQSQQRKRRAPEHGPRIEIALRDRGRLRASKAEDCPRWILMRRALYGARQTARGACAICAKVRVLCVGCRARIEGGRCLLCGCPRRGELVLYGSWRVKRPNKAHFSVLHGKKTLLMTREEGGGGGKCGDAEINAVV